MHLMLILQLTNNTAVGYASLSANTTGLENVAVGTQSLCSNVSGSCNVAIGQESGSKHTVSNLTAVGYLAGACRFNSNTTVILQLVEILKEQVILL
jgi:trimeric autotransporter adhesin